jgi:metal-responsive CopG/Arc/MetJ family transcriptional regulator
MIEKKPPRGMYSLRIHDDAIAEVDRLAADEMRTRSDMLRKLLAEALAARAKRKH